MERAENMARHEERNLQHRANAVHIVVPGHYCKNLRYLGKVKQHNPESCLERVQTEAQCVNGMNHFTYSKDQGHCACCLNVKDATRETAVAKAPHLADIYDKK